MMNIRKIHPVFIWIFVLVFLQACFKKKEKIVITQNSHINNQNIVTELQKYVKQYPKQPLYYTSYKQNYYFFEVLVNDILIFKRFERPGGTSAYDINQAIFKSGTQKVTFRLYPVGKIMDGYGSVFNTFIDDTQQIFNIEQSDHRYPKIQGSVIKQYKTPSIPNPVNRKYLDSIFITTGKDYYENSFTFEAEVPYQLDGFKKAHDLRNMNKKKLEAKLLEKYQEIWSVFQNREYDNIARISFDRLKNNVITYYHSKQEAKEDWESDFSTFSNPTFEMQPLENYELKFFAEGKLVALISKSKDPRLRGSSALQGKFKENGKERAFSSNAFFYIPKGESVFRVY